MSVYLLTYLLTYFVHRLIASIYHGCRHQSDNGALVSLGRQCGTVCCHPCVTTVCHWTPWNRNWKFICSDGCLGRMLEHCV